MQHQFRAGYVDIEVGDIVNIDGDEGELYEIRFCQEIRSGECYFQCRLENGRWVNVDQVQVIKRIH